MPCGFIRLARGLFAVALLHRAYRGLDPWTLFVHICAMPLSRLRIGIVGAGHFGRYHALKLAASARAVLAGVNDRHAERARTVGTEVGAPDLDLAPLLAASDAVVVAVPAAAHHAVAAAALRAGKHVLVEKPIAATLAEADELAALAAERRLVLQVGHLERFSAARAALTGRMGAPLYIEATRIAPFKLRGTDVSVILDLMIHDLDLVLSLVASPVEQVDAVGAAVASELEDIANARIRFASGAVATITASRVATRTERRMRIFARDAYLVADFANRRMTLIRRGEGHPIPGLPQFGSEEHSWEEHDALEAEQAAFVASVLDGAPVLVDAAAGRRALAAALSVADAMHAARARMAASGLLQQIEHRVRGGT
jgi:predicted dehydrogenase